MIAGYCIYSKRGLNPVSYTHLITGNVKSALAEEALQDTTSMLALNNNTDEPSLSVFPNPASEYISLSFSAEQAGTATAVITDLNGSCLLYTSAITIKLSKHSRPLNRSTVHRPGLTRL